MKNIVVVGSLNLDLVAYVPRMPVEGETISGTDFAMFPGGKGANQAVAAARLGSKVTMVGRLGNDGFGQQLRDGLERNGVGKESVISCEKPTGTAIITVNPAGGNSIIVIPGANYALSPEALETHTDVLRSADVILAQLEIPIETVVRLAEMAAQLNKPFVLDPAPAQSLPDNLLRNVTWLTPNESETRTILDHLGYHAEEDATSEAALEKAAERLLEAGAQNVILKLGARGVFVAAADGTRRLIEPYRVNVVDSTAAGDAFNGGFAYGLTQGMTHSEAAQFACAVAAASVTKVGAQPSMPTLEEVRNLMHLPLLQKERSQKQS